MGNKQSQIKISLDDFPNNYIFIKTVNSDLYRSARLYKHIATKNMIAKIGLEQGMNQNQIETIQLFKDLQNYVVQFIDWTEVTDFGDFCKSNNNKVYLYYEYVPSNLEKEISLQKEKGVHFEEQKVWYLFVTMITLLRELYKMNRTHQNISPKTVLVHENGSIKLAPIGLFPFDLNAYQRLIIMNEKTYIAPEYFLRGIQSIDWIKNDIFAAGLTLLDLMTLSDSYNIYDNLQQFDFLIDRRIKSVQHLYSRKLIKIVKMMTLPSKQRVAFLDLLTLMKENQDQQNGALLSPTPEHQKRSLKNKFRIKAQSPSNLKLSNVPFQIYSQNTNSKFIQTPTLIQNKKIQTRPNCFSTQNQSPRTSNITIKTIKQKENFSPGNYPSQSIMSRLSRVVCQTPKYFNRSTQKIQKVNVNNVVCRSYSPSLFNDQLKSHSPLTFKMNQFQTSQGFHTGVKQPIKLGVVSQIRLSQSRQKSTNSNNSFSDQNPLLKYQPKLWKPQVVL